MMPAPECARAAAAWTPRAHAVPVRSRGVAAALVGRKMDALEYHIDDLGARVRRRAVFRGVCECVCTFTCVCPRALMRDVQGDTLVKVRKLNPAHAELHKHLHGTAVGKALDRHFEPCVSRALGARGATRRRPRARRRDVAAAAPTMREALPASMRAGAKRGRR